MPSKPPSKEKEKTQNKILCKEEKEKTHQDNHTNTTMPDTQRGDEEKNIHQDTHTKTLSKEEKNTHQDNHIEALSKEEKEKTHSSDGRTRSHTLLSDLYPGHPETVPPKLERNLRHLTNLVEELDTIMPDLADSSEESGDDSGEDDSETETEYHTNHTETLEEILENMSDTEVNSMMHSYEEDTEECTSTTDETPPNTAEHKLSQTPRPVRGPQVRRLGGFAHQGIRKICKALSKLRGYQEDVLLKTGQHIDDWSTPDKWIHQSPDEWIHELKDQEEAIRNDDVVAHIRNVGGSLFLKTTAGSTVIWTLIDGGANINLIRQDVYQNIVKGMDQVTRENLEIKHQEIKVAVANENTWRLRQSVTLTIWAEGRPIRGRFWITDRLSDDIILGLPTQREYSMSVHTRNPNRGGDTMQIREFDEEHIKLFNVKGGIRSGEVPPRSTVTVKARTRQDVKVKILGGTQIAWPVRRAE